MCSYMDGVMEYRSAGISMMLALGVLQYSNTPLLHLLQIILRHRQS
jgi:hypothetical protein